MAYNLYQAQMARGWQQRIEKEQAQQDRFWAQEALKRAQGGGTHTAHGAKRVGASGAASDAQTGCTSQTAALAERMTMLEEELRNEKASRQKLEEQLMLLKTGSSFGSTTTSSKPGTPGSLV